MRRVSCFLDVGVLVLLVGALMMCGSDGVASEPPDTPVSGQAGLHTEITQGVKGRVMTLAGKPVRNTLVSAKSLDIPAKPVPELAILTNGDGYYSWPLRPGDYEITVAGERHEATSERVTVRPQEITRLDLVLPQ